MFSQGWCLVKGGVPDYFHPHVWLNLGEHLMGGGTYRKCKS